MNNFKEVSALLANRAEDVARYLLSNGKKEGNEWRAGNIHGDSGQSLGVHLTGDKAGIWKDFATDQSGDLLDLWRLNRNLSISAALKEARGYLGLADIRFESYKPTNFVRPIKKITPPLDKSPVMTYLVQERKLTVETLHAFKIGEQPDKIILPYYRDGQLIFVKYLGLQRPEGKKQISVEKNCEPCLFGWHLVPNNARTITITEGELDAMSLYQYGITALSVPFGGGSGRKHEWLEYEFDRLAVFDEIFLCFDNDSAGQTAVIDLIERLGLYRCRIVKLPLKDANACLQAGISKKEMEECFAAARTLDPEELKQANHFVNDVIEEFYPTGGCPIGYSPPWEKARDKILFRPEELSVWSGINGHGKSQLLGQIILSCMKQDARVCIASLELKPKRLLMRLTRQAAALAEPSENYIRAIHEWYSNKLWLFDLVGTAKAKRLLEVFLYARKRYGINVFVIDSFMKLDIAEDDYRAQKTFIEQLCDFKNQHNCHIHIVIHPRKAMNEEQIPNKLDVKGTGAISDLADNCFTIWRNKKKEELIRIKASGGNLSNDQLEKLNTSDCLLICDKQRNGDWEGKLSLWFDNSSFQYLSNQTQKPIQYVQYSTDQSQQA